LLSEKSVSSKQHVMTLFHALMHGWRRTLLHPVRVQWRSVSCMHCWIDWRAALQTLLGERAIPARLPLLWCHVGYCCLCLSILPGMERPFAVCEGTHHLITSGKATAKSRHEGRWALAGIAHCCVSLQKSLQCC